MRRFSPLSPYAAMYIRTLLIEKLFKKSVFVKILASAMNPFFTKM